MSREKKESKLTRRQMMSLTLRGAGAAAAAAAAAALPLPALEAPQARNTAVPATPTRVTAADLTGQLARYIVAARDRALPAKVLTDSKQHLLDTLAAMISGARLEPGQIAIRFVRTQGGTPEASVVTTGIETSAINAALANGMFAHADETDDFEPVTKAHPGCSVVPAALAIAEREGRRSGTEFLRAMALGYDICCRFLMALDPDLVRATHRSAETFGGAMGSVAAAASLARLDETQTRYALSYGAQQVSGLWSWTQDTEHIEKAFDFGGMGARNGVTSALMAQAGFTGVRNVFAGEHNVLEALSPAPRPQQMLAGLGERYWISETAIKTYSAGYPMQAALDAFLALRRENGLNAQNVEKIVVRLPEDAAGIVDNSAMPDVNLQYIMAVALIEGAVSFANANSRQHMSDPQVRAAMARVQLIGDKKFEDPAAPRSAQVDVTLRDARTVSRFVKYPSGTKENPLDNAAVNAKARDLIVPVVGSERAETIIKRVNMFEEVTDVRAFVRTLLTE